MADESTLAFRQLSPDAVLDAVESKGYVCDGHLLALNSYENRVYQVGIEGEQPIIAKFYRPERWSDAVIEEELIFSVELSEAEIPVIAPLVDDRGQMLHHHQAYRFSLYPRRGGHAPELDNPDHLEQLGRLIARIHNIGVTRPFEQRKVLNSELMGTLPREYVLRSGMIPVELETAYATLTEDLLLLINACYQRAGQVVTLRLHGDCHPGNILNRGEQFYILDFDDSCTGPAIQDLWMFLSGDRQNMTTGLMDVLEGYTQFRDFNPAELNLIEALRTLRQIHYTAWIAKRWEDPAFPKAFPWFDTSRYWENHILELREQMALMQEAPIVWN
ncbi:MAG: serine/threonine protein kinase [Methylococcales bacterium]